MRKDILTENLELDPVLHPWKTLAVIKLHTVLAFAGIAVSAVFAYDFAVRIGVIDSAEEIMPRVLQWLSTTLSSDWATALYIALILAGLFLLIIAFGRRKLSHIPLNHGHQLWASPSDLARMCSERAQSVPGIMKAQTLVSRSIVVRAYGGGLDDAVLHEQVTAAVSELLDQLPTRFDLRVVISGQVDA